MEFYKRLISYIPESKGNIFLSLLVSTLSTIVTVFGYYYVFKIVRALLVEEKYLYAESLAFKTVILLILGAFLYFVSGFFSHISAFRLETNLRKKGIDGLTKASFRFFDLNPSGIVRKTIDDNAEQTHQAIAHLIPDIPQAFMTPILVIVLSFIVSLRTGITVVIITIVSAFILKFMMGESEFMQKYQDSLKKLSAETVEYVRGIQVVKIFNANIESFKVLGKAITDYSEYAYGYTQTCKKPYVLYQTLIFSVVAFLVMLSVIFLDKFSDLASLTVDIIMVFFVIGIMFVTLMKIMFLGQFMFEANYALDELEKLYKKMDVDNLKTGNEEKIDNYDIEFRDVRFAYGEVDVFDGLSFKLDENKTYALVGNSGSGKSTIAKLLSGFYKVDGGSILIGNKPIEDYSTQALIKAVSFVFQDPKLFKKSIYENVAIAKKDASRVEVMRALELARCNDILDKFSDRENTIIGSKGVYLSGGEKQRIAIARAILKDSKIILMDEASASIDADNEYELQRSFKNLMEGKTVIMIAHRLSSIKSVDEILVCEDGNIIERGSHDELIKKDSKYKRLSEAYEYANDWRVSNEAVL